MDQSVFWTHSYARLQRVRGYTKEGINWLFLPGGPGMGSESLLPLINILKLPGNFWLLDLPGDGSNTTANNAESFSHWASAIVEAVCEFNRVILVAHSTGGMYALSLPELENHLEGLVLLDSAPNASWQASYSEFVASSPIPSVEILQDQYVKNPNNDILRELTIASSPYLFNQEGFEAGVESLRSLPYNYESCEWSAQHFDQTYQAKWIPQMVSTLILAGEEDLITPLKYFEEDKRFCRDNISLKSIKRAGHFPWIENPVEVANAFSAYAKQFV